MADISITAANVKASSTSQILLVQYGEAVDQGETVYKKSDGKYWLADNVSATLAAVAGIALTPNTADGYGVICTRGIVDMGTTLTVGTTYVQSANAGKVAPEADVGSGEFVTILGVASTAALLVLNINATGIAHV